MRLLLQSWMAALSLAVLAGAASAATDAEQILGNIKEIQAPGAAVSPLAVWGPTAEVVLTGRSGANRLPIIACARVNKGRVVLAGHGGLYDNSANHADRMALRVNTVNWLAAGKPKANVLLAGCHGWKQTLDAVGYQTKECDPAHIVENLAGADVVLSGVADFHGDLTPIQRFIAAGGGFFDYACGWGWQQVTGKSLRTDFPINQLLSPIGLAIADNMVDETAKSGFAVDGQALELTNAAKAADALEASVRDKKPLDKATTAQISTTLIAALDVIPAKDTLLRPRIVAMINQPGVNRIPTRKTPLELDNPLGRLACVIEDHEMSAWSIDQLRPHPSAAAFPGDVPADAPRVDATVEIDTSVPDWHSLGLYAAPGEIIEITLPDNAVKAGLGVRINAHTDTLWHLDKWSRFPSISRATALKSTMTRFGNPFGGTVYITVPGGCKLGKITVGVKGALNAPLFVEGKTSLADWKATIRNYPGRWAELASDKIILTIPSTVIRELDDPQKLLQVWDQGLDAIADLGATSRVRTRPERMTCDMQISAGYMHSGYPVMTWLDVPAKMVSVQNMTSGASGAWGFWHELGHNHQKGWWTFDGTGEVTNNLFSLYCNEIVSGEKVANSTWLSIDKRSKDVQKYFEEGAKFDKWKSDPGLALMFYAQLQQAFGWEAFHNVFASYYKSKESELPHSDEQKRDQWMTRFSREVGRNLGPFFTAWGIPTSQAARDSIADLPQWLPKDFKQGIPFDTKG